MKATLEFTLPEEREEWEITNRALDLSANISTVDNYCRSVIKYNEISLETEDHLQKIREMLAESTNF